MEKARAVTAWSQIFCSPLCCWLGHNSRRVVTRLGRGPTSQCGTLAAHRSGSVHKKKTMRRHRFLLRTAHHLNRDARIDDDRYNGNQAVIGDRRETEEPLSRMRGCTKTVRLCRWGPDVVAANRWPHASPDRLVVTVDHLTHLTTERKREYGYGKEKRCNHSESRDTHA